MPNTNRLWIYEKPEELAKERFDVEGWVGIKVPITKKPDMAKIEPAMKKAKKPAELWATCDVKKLVLEVRVGTAFKQVIGEQDFEKEKDVEKRRALLKKINAKDKKLITDKNLYDFSTAHPEQATLDDARGQVAGVKLDIEKLQAKVATLKTLSYDHCGSAELKSEFRGWIEKKHWGHYLDFLDDVDAGADSKKIYDTYIGDGKQAVSKPVNLDAGTAGKIRQALEANKVPDFAAARSHIVNMVDTKFVPEFKKENLPGLEKELAHKQGYLGELNALLAKQ